MDHETGETLVVILAKSSDAATEIRPQTGRHMGQDRNLPQSTSRLKSDERMVQWTSRQVELANGKASNM